MKELKKFYRGKRVLITGHTGFKGSWMCKVLVMLGAEVTGYALEPPTQPALFEVASVEQGIRHVIGDMLDLRTLMKVFDEVQPEIVIHMAAQPIVREAYKNPVGTYAVNVMGTVNVLECCRLTQSVRSVINVTTDKVYLNREWEWGYRENEKLNGYDPYSNSKSCSELVTDSYRNSYFKNGKCVISTCRAGNVIGGGDFAVDRIIPDCFRSAKMTRNIVVRNPYSIRPYQHVLEPVIAYLLVAMKQYNDAEYEGAYNIGPEESDCVATVDIVTMFCDEWKKKTGKDVMWVNECVDGPHEAKFLKLDCSKIKSKLGWKPVWSVECAIDKLVSWYVAYLSDENMVPVMEDQITEYLSMAEFV